MRRRLEAVIFDLYGTLVRIKSPGIHREIPRVLGVRVQPWIQLVRERLMTTPFRDRASFVHFICQELTLDPSPEVEAQCAAAVDRELESIELCEGVPDILAFLRSRGVTLGLVSNLTSPHKEPLTRFALDQYFSAMALSCDQGMLKPEPRLYIDLCDQLGVRPESVLVVGDSWKNDVLAPRALGMQAVHVGARAEEGGISQVSDLSWRALEPEPVPIVTEGLAVRLGGVGGTLRELAPLDGSEQGHFNMVAQARLVTDALEAGMEVLCKRFVFPEAAYVEEFSHRLHAEIDLPCCEVFLHAGAEPVLVMARARGQKFEGPVDPPLAFELGRHCAAAYLFANADLRPRNAFLAYDGARPLITIVDLEHCLFNLALDVAGLDDPTRPDTFDRLSASEVSRRVRRQVLSERTTRRAMGAFLKLDSLESEVAIAFRNGWVTGFRRVQSESDRLCALIDERVHTEPFLIIGTRSYRRAMATFDVEDMRRRMRQDPEVLFPRLAAVREGVALA